MLAITTSYKHLLKFPVHPVKMLLLFLQFLAVPSSTLSLCTQSRLDKCMAPLKLLLLGKPTSIVPMWTKQDTIDICKGYTGFEECWGPSRTYCEDSNRVSFESNHNFYDYLCREKFTEYLLHRICFSSSVNLKRDGNKCNKMYTQQREHIRQNTQLSTQDRSWKLCEYISEYKDCLERAVRRCGSEATDWMGGMAAALLRPTSTYLNCSPSILQMKSSAIAYSSVDTTILCLMLCCSIWFRRILIASVRM